jgi:hypothetical protein
MTTGKWHNGGTKEKILSVVRCTYETQIELQSCTHARCKHCTCEPLQAFWTRPQLQVEKMSLFASLRRSVRLSEFNYPRTAGRIFVEFYTGEFTNIRSHINMLLKITRVSASGVTLKLCGGNPESQRSYRPVKQPCGRIPAHDATNQPNRHQTRRSHKGQRSCLGGINGLPQILTGECSQTEMLDAVTEITHHNSYAMHTYPNLFLYSVGRWNDE